MIGRRVVVLSDSLAVIGAMTKGRSSSPRLCLRCRKAAALTIAHDLEATSAAAMSHCSRAAKLIEDIIRQKCYVGSSNETELVPSQDITPSAAIVLQSAQLRGVRTSGSQRLDIRHHPDCSSTALTPSARIVLQASLVTPALSTQHPIVRIEDNVPYQRQKRRREIQGGRVAKSASRSAKNSVPDLFQNVLIAATLKPDTRRKYSEVIVEFLTSQQGLPATAQAVDDAISDYILKRFYENPKAGEKSKMNCLTAGFCVLYPHLRGCLRKSQRYLAGWEKLVPLNSALPLTRDLMKAFVAQLLHQGEKECAMVLAIAWAGYLRGNEALRLRWKDIGLPGDPRLSGIDGNTAGVNIKDGKTGQNQFVPIIDKQVIRMLTMFSEERRQQPMYHLFSLTYKKYLKLVKDVSISLGLSGKPMTTHSTRIGGAVHAYSAKTSVKDIAITGRWESLKSLRRYLANGRGWLMNLNISSGSQQKISELIASFDTIFAEHTF